MQLNNLMIEVTRRCNMTCIHCLRGDTQEKDIAHEHIAQTLFGVDHIEMITFSGGEPSLNVAAIKYTTDFLIGSNIPLGAFFIATNGMTNQESLIVECLRLYNHAFDRYTCLLRVSQDAYHGDVDVGIYKGLRFASASPQRPNVINRGRARTNGLVGHNNPYSHEKISVCDECVDGEVYLNALGDVIDGCDWSYKTQPLHKYCKASEFYSKVNK